MYETGTLHNRRHVIIRNFYVGVPKLCFAKARIPETLSRGSANIFFNEF
jgi:hypothetical protein